MTAEIVSLKEYRKQKRKRTREKEARENRSRFGRTKAQRLEDQADARRKQRELDGKRLDDETEEPA